MAFGGFEMPEEFKGKTKDQLVDELRAGKEAIAKVSEMEGKFGQLQSTNEALQTSFAAVTDKLAQIEVGLQERRPAQQQQQQQEKKQFTSVVEDEDRAFDERFADRFEARAKPLYTGILMQQAHNARREGMDQINSNPTLKNAYAVLKAECEAIFKTLTPQQQLEAGSYPGCVQLCIGQNLGKLKDMFNKDNGGLDLLSSNGIKQEDNQQTFVLDEDMKRAAKRFGMTEKEYAEAAML